LEKALRPVDLARSIGVSTQAVRNYERWGFLPEAERGPQGYRLYSQQHLHALRTSRSLIAGFGWEHTLRIMQYIHQNDLAGALAVIDARHAAIHQSRREVEETLDILRTIARDLPHSSEGSAVRKSPHYFRIGEAARRVGVRVSAARFWEEQGLIQPIRESSSRYRLYDEKQIRILQTVALLRKTGYGFETIGAVLAQLASGAPEQVLAAAENRHKELVETSCRCVEATALLWAYIEERGHSQDE